jgi:Tfp pilus assembly protein PilO
MPELSVQDNITLLSRVIFFADISVASSRDGKTGKYNFRSATGTARS